MPNKDKDRLQGSMYDKVFRENMLEILPSIIEQVLNLDIVTIEELKDDIQYLCDLAENLEKVMMTIAKYIKEEEDFLYTPLPAFPIPHQAKSEV